MEHRFFYSLFRRKNAKKEKIFFARFFDEETRELVATFSTKTSNRKAALIWADEKLIDEIGLKPSFASRLIETMKAARDPKPARYALEICLEELKNAVRDNAEEKAEVIHLLGDALAAMDSNKGMIFVDFLVDFWDWEKSEYIKRRLAEGHRIGRTHAANCKRYSENHARRFFGDRYLISITTDDLEKYKLFLTNQRCTVPKNRAKRVRPEDMPFLDPGTVNKIFRSALVAINDAYRRGLIPTNPAANISMLAEKVKSRGILSQKEALKVLRSKYWNDERYRLASELAAASGMRLGEICALEIDKVHEEMVEVSASYDKKYNEMKDTKSGKVRYIPLEKNLEKKLRALAKKNPWYNGFIFWGKSQDAPLAGSAITNGFLRALRLSGITDEERHKRRISFHGWRRYANSNLARVLDPAKLRKVIGHSDKRLTDERLTDRYTELTAEDIALMKKEQTKMIPFRKIG